MAGLFSVLFWGVILSVLPCVYMQNCALPTVEVIYSFRRDVSQITPELGTSIRLQCTVSSPINVSEYIWQKDSHMIAGRHNRYYSIESVQVSDGGLYQCGVETSCGTVFSTNNISIIIAVNNTVDNSTVGVQMQPVLLRTELDLIGNTLSLFFDSFNKTKMINCSKFRLGTHTGDLLGAYPLLPNASVIPAVFGVRCDLGNELLTVISRDVRTSTQNMCIYIEEGSGISRGGIPLASNMSGIPITDIFTVPGEVTGIRLHAINSSSVSIQWEPAHLETGTVIHYSVYYFLLQSLTPMQTVTSEENSVIVSGLNAGEQYTFYVTVTAVINGQSVEGKRASNSTTFQLPRPDGCPVDRDVWNIQWFSTDPGTKQMQPCGAELTGTASRECNEDATWAETDVTGCQSRQFMELTSSAEALLSEESYNTTASLALVEELIEVTVPNPKVPRSLFPSELNTSNIILTVAVDALIADFNQTGVADPAQSIFIVEAFSNLLEEDNQAGWGLLQQKDVGSQVLLNNAERYALYVAMATTNTTEGVVVSKENIVTHISTSLMPWLRPSHGFSIPDINSSNLLSLNYTALRAKQLVADGSGFQDDTFPTVEELTNTSFEVSSGMIRIPGSLLEEIAQQSNLKAIPVASIMIQNLGRFLPNSLAINMSDSNGSQSMAEVKSVIISSQVGEQSGSIQALQDDQRVEISFTLEQNFKEESDSEPHCAFWKVVDSMGNGEWSFDGLTTEVVSNKSVQCLSTHLTSFAILVNVGRSGGGNMTVAEMVLEYISYIGCGVSITCLIISIIFLLTSGRDLFKRPHTFIHLNLCISLLLGYAVFVGGVDFATNIQWLCTTVAALLHYFFLAVFCWMLCEGIMLFLMLVVVFTSLSKRWWVFLLIGWGVPIIFVAIGLGVQLDQYGTDEYCWISTNVRGVIWLFVAPMLLIILINTVFLVLALVNLRKTLKEITERTKKRGMTKHADLATRLLKATVVILPLLGITWALGLLAVNADDGTLVFAYLFTVFNSLQGFFIFFFHVLRDDKIWGRMKKQCFKRKGGQEATGSTVRTLLKSKRETNASTAPEPDENREGEEVSTACTQPLATAAV